MNGIDLTCWMRDMGLDGIWVELRLAADQTLSTERRLAPDNDDIQHLEEAIRPRAEEIEEWEL